MTPELQFKCNESWEDMKIGVLGKQCLKCDKHVHDFTRWTREDIVLFLLQNRDKQICGRLRSYQIDFSYEEQLIVINRLYNRNRHTNLAYYLLSMGTLLMMSCSNQELSKQAFLQSDSTVNIQHTGTDSIKSDSIDTGSQEEQLPIAPLDYTGDILTGEVNVLYPDTITEPYIEPQTDIMGNVMIPFADSNNVYNFADIMPEFEGGTDSLNAYFNRKLQSVFSKYPDMKNSVTYVSFIVDESGHVIDPELLRIHYSMENYSELILNAVKEMPQWSPAELNGKKVKLRMNLPVRFH